MNGQFENKEGFMRLSKVLTLIPISKSSWWAGVKSGKYPKPIKISNRTTAWKNIDIFSLIEKLSNGGKNDV
ncbi:MAG: helix-turn-helix transcriptional regulator [Alphaproteobacteria bacterium]|jgi:prophage regulatory protein